MAEVSIKKTFTFLLQHLSADSKRQYYPQREEEGGRKLGSFRQISAARELEHAEQHRSAASWGRAARAGIYRGTLCATAAIAGNEPRAMRR